MSEGSVDVWTTALVAEIASPEPRAIAIGPFGSRLKADLYVPAGFPVIRGQDIGPGKSLLEDRLVFVSDSVAQSLASCIVRDGDLIFPHRGAIGTVGIVGTRPYLLSSSMMKLTCNRDLVDPKYVFYYFRGPGKDELLMRASTVGTPGIGQPLKSLRGIPIKFPALQQQRAIAEVLGALDDKIDSNTRLAKAASTLAGSLYDQAVASVPLRMMSQILTPVLGGTPSRANSEFWTGSHPWASAKDVTGASCGVIVDTEERISDLAIGSVILTARGTVGAVARLSKPSSFNQSCYGFVPGPLPAGVLYFSILRATDRAKAFAHGSVFDTITMKTFDHLYVPDLRTSEASGLEELLAPILDAGEFAVIENSSLAATRDALLPQLMSGKLRVKDAEKVLERVL
jgi:type I restriction enzyme S subunit